MRAFLIVANAIAGCAIGIPVALAVINKIPGGPVIGLAGAAFVLLFAMNIAWLLKA